MWKRLHFLIPISPISLQLLPNSLSNKSPVGMIARENLLLQNYESEKNNKNKSDGVSKSSKVKQLNFLLEFNDDLA